MASLQIFWYHWYINCMVPSFPSESVQTLFLTRPQGVHERFSLGTRLGIHLLESTEQVSQPKVTLLQ